MSSLSPTRKAITLPPFHRSGVPYTGTVPGPGHRAHSRSDRVVPGNRGRARRDSRVLWHTADHHHCMSRIPSVTGFDLIAALGKLRFSVLRIKGSHHFLRHDDGRRTLSAPSACWRFRCWRLGGKHRGKPWMTGARSAGSSLSFSFSHPIRLLIISFFCWCQLRCFYEASIKWSAVLLGLYLLLEMPLRPCRRSTPSRSGKPSPTSTSDTLVRAPAPRPFIHEYIYCTPLQRRGANTVAVLLSEQPKP
jgi:hypothetical protein